MAISLLFIKQQYAPSQTTASIQPLWMAEGVQESGAKKAKLEREGDEDDDEVEKR